jgi:CBS domain-containing protein
MRLKELMTTGVETVDRETPADAALETMRRRRIRHLVVVRGREILGVVSDRDLAGYGEEPTPIPRPVRDFMTEDPVTAPPTATVREAANLLRGSVIGCLPVVDARGRLVGIVTTADLLDLVGRGTERPAPKGQRPTMRRRGPRPKPIHR